MVVQEESTKSRSKASGGVLWILGAEKLILEDFMFTQKERLGIL